MRLDFLPFLGTGFRYWFLFILEPMKPPQPRRKCLHCKELFLPDYRGGQRQCYCLQPDCRKARKRELMRAWLAKPENQNYFRDDQNAQRARDWQKEHPGYWKNTARYRRRTLQDGCQRASSCGSRSCEKRSRPYLTRPLFDASSSVCGAYLHVRRQYLTRRHRHQHPATGNQGTRHSGHGARHEP